MRTALLGILASAFLLGGCASTQTQDAQAPMPDARDLAERPLDVLGMPQP